MTATRSPVRLTVLHNGDYCDEACTQMHHDWCGFSGAALQWPDNVTISKYLRTEACKAATAPRSCAGCVRFSEAENSGFCFKFGEHVGGSLSKPEPLMQCDGPVFEYGVAKGTAK